MKHNSVALINLMQNSKGNPTSLELKTAAHEKSRNRDVDAGEDDLVLPLEKLSIVSRKKLLVLDVNGLLVHRVFRFDPDTKVQNYPPDAIFGSFLVFIRPFCSEFLEFCFERFEVGVWSSAKERNIDTILSTIKTGLKDKLLFVWDQEKCTDSGFKSLEKKHKPIFLKELRKLWEDPTLPWCCGTYSSSNTLLIDDEPYKALLNPILIWGHGSATKRPCSSSVLGGLGGHCFSGILSATTLCILPKPNTAIFPQPYKVDNKNDTVLESKGELCLFLDGLADADGVPSYVNEHPIGQPGITDSHTNWNYYSKIIHRFR